MGAMATISLLLPLTFAMKPVAVTLLVERAIADGAIRDDVTPLDLLRAQIGFSYEITHPDWQASARRLIDIFMDGLKCKR